MKDFPLPLLGFCAWSGTGKTTLLSRLIPLLRRRGLRPAIVKHAHHDFDIDKPGKDSWKLRHAGASQTVVASRNRAALIREYDDGRPEPSLADSLRLLDPDTLDLVLVEGFKHEPFAKIELHRPAMGRDLICAEVPEVIAVASDAPVTLPRPLPLLDLNDPPAIADFVLQSLDKPLPRVAP
ncbi:MAG: molybdopterin-guanine dinucleotide biosynthesis protein B [Gammaproteobacteria bacterium]|nr:MAG: molybdopterin-guanine dinucleotide biosynthesis protein B [Gammaproteobacteria bacterium]